MQTIDLSNRNRGSLLVLPEAVWLWWSMHAGAARLMGPDCQGPLMEFNRRIFDVV